MIKILGIFFVFVGTIFSFLGSLGLIRMKDIYNRLQTSTKATTLGSFATIIGIGILNPSWIFKAVIIAFFILITAPISSHSLANATHKTGIGLKKDEFDALSLTEREKK